MTSDPSRPISQALRRPGTSGDILIVDDLPENLRVLAAILEQDGFKVRLAPDGAFALRAAALRRPDLILLDVRMPGMDGIETCRRMRADPTLREIPVLFLSASEEPEQRLEAFRVGGVDFIGKPFNAEEVLARVSSHLAISRLRSELAAANAKLTGQVHDESAARRVAEHVARDSSERLDLALAAAGMGTWEVDAQGGALRLDTRARSVLGVTERVPNVVDDLVQGFAEPDRTAIAAAWQTAIATGGPVAIEGLWTLLPGQRRIRLRGEPSSIEGAPLRFIGLAWDVTAEHELRDRLAQSEKLECLGRLAGGVAHDFNNHLAVIMGTVDLIRSRPDIDPSIARWMDNVARAGESAAALVRDLLTFARKREARLEVIDLGQLAERSASLVSSLIGRRIALTATGSNTPLPVRGNAEQLQNALLNLCVNARDAMATGGNLKISAERCTLADTRCRVCGQAITGEHAVLSVADDGTGIPDDLQDRIFEPFFTTKPEGKGTGLGLATVVGCVKQHQGHLSLESHLGTGSTFRIHLPLA